MSDFDIVGPEAIRDSAATDAYFERIEVALRRAGKNPRVVAEVTASQSPDGDFELFVGVKDTTGLFAGRNIDVDAMLEGTLFDRGPVMRIESDYLGSARLETSFLDFLSYVSSCVTAVFEARSTTPDSIVLSFGTRHIHPAIVAMVERSAPVAGLDGFPHAVAGKTLGKEAPGMISHALLIAFGRSNQVEAFCVSDRAVDENASRVALCDIYGSETEEVLQAVEVLSDDLGSIHLDTTSSRRDDFRHIIRGVRWELDARGREDVSIFASGDLGPAELRHLRDVVEGLGVGGHISSADPVNFALGVVEVSGEPAAKRGKLSGVKEVYRMADGGHHVGLRGRPGPIDGESLLEPLIHDGEVVLEFDFDIDAVVTRAGEDAESVGFGGVSEE